MFTTILARLTVLFAALFALMIFGFLQIWFRSDILQTVYAVIGAIIFSAYIVVDTQMMIGGSHSVKFTGLCFVRF